MIFSASIKPGDTWYKASLAHRGTLVDPESCSATNSQENHGKPWKTVQWHMFASCLHHTLHHTPGPCDVRSLLATWASQKAIKVSMISVQSSMPRLLQRALKKHPLAPGYFSKRLHSYMNMYIWMYVIVNFLYNHVSGHVLAHTCIYIYVLTLSDSTWVCTYTLALLL